MTAGWWRRLVGGVDGSAGGGRTSGRPRSSNGASSFHLGWVISGEFVSAAVTLEVVEPPTARRLYFWALQADFGDGAGRAGGAHLGLQWHPQYPGSTAVNWGGYRSGGGELVGSESPLPSSLRNPNTRDLQWAAHVPHRLEISRVEPPGTAPVGMTAWRGSVRNLVSDTLTVVRDLYVPASSIVGLTMWSEVFADCDDPPACVRWSDPVAQTAGGRRVVPDGLSVNYQSHAAGGCANSDSSVDGIGVVQRTGTERSTPQGTRLPLR